MAHDNLPEGIPGIRGPMMFRPETVKPLNEMVMDTVLIAAVFCLCHRYLDGLAAWTPEEPEFYRQGAAKIATDGYTASTVSQKPRQGAQSA